MSKYDDLREGKILITFPEMEKFFNSVHKTSGCWNWIGYKDKNGYARMTVRRLQTLGHVLSYLIHNGAIPNKLHVLHSCDNPSCVNPNHLWLGTHQENMKDKDEKGRHGKSGRFGENINFAKITANDAKEIRYCVSLGAKQVDMVKRFGIKASAINSIIKNKTWKQAI